MSEDVTTSAETAEHERAPVEGSEPFVIVTGLSGSGKSLAHRCFEDMGYFCVDNLPCELILKLSEMKCRGGEGLARVALTLDVRTHEFVLNFPDILQELRERHDNLRLVFLEADDSTLMRRFSETRRPHPLVEDGTLEDGIKREREQLAMIRSLSTAVIDTSEFTAHQLRDHLWERFGSQEVVDRLHVAIVSFGFRNGVPKQADLVFDVRFLPNPYYVDHLRPQAGTDRPVQEFLEARPEYREFVQRLDDFLDFLLPAYHREGKSYLTIAIGCTGGRHRSVALTEEMHGILNARGLPVSKSHRDSDLHPKT